MTIADKVKASRGLSLYQQAAKKFETSYDYVVLIAVGKRKATRGKGREIKEWLEKQIQK